MSEAESAPAIVIDAQLCKGCGLCVATCPNGVLQLSTKLNEKGYTIAEVAQSGACIKCHKCVLICPDLAIDVYDTPEEIEVK